MSYASMAEDTDPDPIPRWLWLTGCIVLFVAFFAIIIVMDAYDRRHRGRGPEYWDSSTECLLFPVAMTCVLFTLYCGARQYRSPLARILWITGEIAVGVLVAIVLIRLGILT